MNINFMNKKMKFNRVIVFVADTIACASFYRDKLGLKPIGDWSEEWAELDCDSCKLAFHQAYGKAGKIGKPTGSPMNPHKIVFTVEDVESKRKELIEKGVRMDEVMKFDELDNLILCDGYDVEDNKFQLCNR